MRRRETHAFYLSWNRCTQECLSLFLLVILCLSRIRASKSMFYECAQVYAFRRHVLSLPRFPFVHWNEHCKDLCMATRPPGRNASCIRKRTRLPRICKSRRVSRNFGKSSIPQTQWYVPRRGLTLHRKRKIKFSFYVFSESINKLFKLLFD